ncbi:MAG: hypothetical protein AAFX87_15230, partial [Bacteroidota bacterium]
MNKTETERWIFDVFNEIYSKFPETTFLHGDKPDFRVELNNKSIGIEVTQLFQDLNPESKIGSKLRRGESMYSKVSDKVLKKLDQSNIIKKISVDIHFKEIDIST